MDRLVTTTHLEMTDASALRPARTPAAPVDVVRVEHPCPELNRFLYATVGAEWWWYSRLPWDRARWLAYLDRAELETWIAYVAGTPAGYVELERQDGGAVEIVYFGRALANYQARGFRVFRVESNVEQLPDAPLEAWPGANAR